MDSVLLLFYNSPELHHTINGISCLSFVIISILKVILNILQSQTNTDA